MRKFLLSILFFVFACANAWAWTKDDYELTGTSSNKTLTITGSGDMIDFESGKAPWYSDCNNITSIVISEGITYVGTHAFQGCTYLQNVTVPTSVTTFGARAFNGCATSGNRRIYYAGTADQWANIEFQVVSGYTTPSSHPFYNSNSSSNYLYLNGDKSAYVTSLVFTSGLTEIKARAFYKAKKITSVTIPTTVTSIQNDAFADCVAIEKIYYAGTPNEWASIAFGNSNSNPFSNSDADNKNFYFYNQTSSANTTLVFTAGLKDIKQYAFYKANKFTDIYIPGTVTNIRTHALDCNTTRLYINKTSVPTTGTSAITFTATSSTRLYLPKDASDSYKATPFYNGSTNVAGAYSVGYSSDKSSIKADGIGDPKVGNTYKMSGTIDAIDWSLAEDGTLLLEGNGSISSSYSGYGSNSTTYDTETVLPWGPFRRLVNKAIIRAKGGDITALNNILQYCYAIDTIIIEQNTIPTGTFSVVNDFKKSTDKVVLKIKSASLADASASNLGSAPWNNARINIQLSDNVVLSDGADNSTLISNLQTYFAGKTFTLQLNRSLTNTQYNTFCSPIALTKEQLNDADIRALTGTSLDGDELTLTFSEDPLDAIEAGKPYLVQPTTEALSNPTFENIAPSSLVSATEDTETEFVDFIGVLAPTGLTGGDHNTLFLGAGNELFWPAEGSGNIKGMRAYFSIKGAARKAAKRARIVMNKEVTTDIETVSGEGLPVTGKKILRNGQLYLMYEGKMYDVRGQLVK